MTGDERRLWQAVDALRERQEERGIQLAEMFKDIRALESQAKRRADSLIPKLGLIVSALALIATLWFRLHPTGG